MVPEWMDTVVQIWARYQPDGHKKWQEVSPSHWIMKINNVFTQFLMSSLSPHLMNNVVVTNKMDKLTVTAASK